MLEAQQLTEEQRKELEEKLKNMSPEELKEFQKQQCIFCQIISGKVPSKKIYEDEGCIAVLDINPAAKGHLLLLPKEHYAIMPQVPEQEINHLFIVAKKLSQVLLRELKVSGTNVFIANGLAAGQRAQHFMIHVIPRKEGDGVLEIEEKLVDKEMGGKVKSLVETKFNEIMGIKKEAGEEGKGLEGVPAKEENEVKKKEEEPKKEAKEEKVEEEKEKATKKKRRGKKKEEEPEKDDENDKASLDDIASLFK